eukprot:scaffold25371_cov34-Tisochrysis_lutea.AAC.1
MWQWQLQATKNIHYECLVTRANTTGIYLYTPQSSNITVVSQSVERGIKCMACLAMVRLTFGGN